MHTKVLHSLLTMETVTLAMRAEHVTNITTPKGKLGIVLLVNEELVQVYFKTTHRLVRFHPMTPRMQNLSCIGQHKCEVIHREKTGTEDVQTLIFQRKN